MLAQVSLLCQVALSARNAGIVVRVAKTASKLDAWTACFFRCRRRQCNPNLPPSSEQCMRFTCGRYLRVDSKDHNFILTEPPMNPPENREAAAEIMFETFNVPGLYIGVQAVLALYAALAANIGAEGGRVRSADMRPFAPGALPCCGSCQAALGFTRPLPLETCAVRKDDLGSRQAGGSPSLL